MAKFIKKARRYGMRAFRSLKRGAKKPSSINPVVVGLSAGAWGFARPYAANGVSAVTNMIPGGYGDELLFGTVGFLASKGTFGNSKLVKSAGTAILAVEAYRIGESFSTGTSTTMQSGWN